MVHNLALPSHAVGMALDLHQDVHVIPEDHYPVRPQDSVHLQQDVFHLAPETQSRASQEGEEEGRVCRTAFIFPRSSPRPVQREDRVCVEEVVGSRIR